MRMHKTVLKLFMGVFFVCLCGCKPKDETASIMEDLGSGKITRVKNAGEQLSTVIQRDPKAVKTALKSNNSTGAWIVTMDSAAQHNPKLFSELLNDLLETTNAPFDWEWVITDIAIKRSETSLQKLSASETAKIHQKLESRLNEIKSPEHKKYVEHFLQQLGNNH